MSIKLQRKNKYKQKKAPVRVPKDSKSNLQFFEIVLHHWIQ